VRLVNTDVALGASGFSVGVLQSELAGLHYAVPLSGSFEEGTANALIAYRKMTGQQLVGTAGRKVFELLARRAGSFHVRYRGDGRHVEANLTKQVLALIEPGGRVHAIYTTSSGKPSTPTVLGRFRVYLKTPGVNSEGMVDSNYFIRGYAIHGYPEVPTYAASHGCLRVPIPDAPAIYAWVREGTPWTSTTSSSAPAKGARGPAPGQRLRPVGPLDPYANRAGHVAKAEAVHEQRQQQLHAFRAPFALDRGHDPRERRGDLAGGFVDRLVHRALLGRRRGVRVARAGHIGDRFGLVTGGGFRLLHREDRERQRHDQAQQKRRNPHHTRYP